MIRTFRRSKKQQVIGIVSHIVLGLAIIVVPAATIGAAETFDDPTTAEGNLLILSGRVLSLDDRPLGGAAVEIWQTDHRGIYDHPGDSDRRNRDRGFQFFGTSVTDNSGQYAFRTILPGRYEPRPRHIHVKIRLNDRTLLTSQLYFTFPENAAGSTGVPADLVVTLEQVDAPAKPDDFRGIFNFTVETGTGKGTGRPTASQGEGPYYPIVDMSLFDNDLAAVP